MRIVRSCPLIENRIFSNMATRQMTIFIGLYQLKVGVGMLSNIQINNSSQCLTYPHQLSVDTIHCFTCYADADQH